MLKIESLSKAYGKKKVLEDISIQFDDGKIHGIIGLNGAGKTTFFNCIAGLLQYDGQVAHSAFHRLKDHIGYVPTEPYFFPRVKGREYLEFIRHAKGEKKIDDAVLSIFDLPLNEYVENYSTGMKRKIAFMGAMIGESGLYILDEPFNGVDIQSNLVLKQHILKLRAEGKTILLSSHIISSLAELCDRIYLLQAGKITREYASGYFADIERDMMALQ